MFKKLLHLIILLPCALFATIAAATDHSIHIEWGYTPPSDPPLSGYNLYQEGTLICTTNNPEATAMDCDVSLEKDSTNFTLTAIFSDGSESPHSAPFPFLLPNDQTTESLAADIGSSVDYEQLATKSSSVNTGSHSFTFHWESTSSAKSYRVYLNNALLCATEDPSASTITCNADLIDGLMTFSMTEVSALGIESAPSNILVFDSTAYPNLFNPKQVKLSWEYPTEKDLAGFRVYHNTTLLCETDNPATRELSCMANLTSPVVQFSIAAVDSNNNETLLSNTLTYTREDQTTNTIASTLSNEPSLLTDTSNNVSIPLANESNDATELTTVSDPTQTTIHIQPTVYTTSLFVDPTESTLYSQTTDTTIPEQTIQTSTETSEQELPSFNLEVGEITVNAQWKSVSLAAPFRHPIIIAKSPITNDVPTGTVHLRNITSTGFEIAYTEQNDQTLEDVTVHYMVMEQGRFLLNQTTLVEAGSFPGSNTVEEINFTEPFATTPVVLTTIATNNQPEFMHSQLIEISTDNFHHSLQTPETNSTVINETIHYIAWEQGSGILDTIMYNASITNTPLLEEANALSLQTLSPLPTFFFPCQLTSIDLTTTATTEGYLVIAPSENEAGQ